MRTEEFNALPLSERTILVFKEGKLINVLKETKFQKGFYYKLNGLNIDILYDKVQGRLLDIKAWNNADERVVFLQVPA